MLLPCPLVIVYKWNKNAIKISNGIRDIPYYPSKENKL